MSTNFDFFVNYECTSATDHFFRNVGEPFVFNVRPTTLSSTAVYWYTLNDSTTHYPLTTTTTFINDVSSIQTITLHCSSQLPLVNSQKTISAIFLDAMPEVDYVSWPMYYIPDNTRLIKLSASNYHLSQSLSFYGEGHKDKISFQAVTNENKQHVWQVSGVNATSLSLTSAELEIQSTPGVSAELPVECKVLDPSLFITTNSPNFYFDDKTGKKLPYKFYYNTNINTSNNTYKQNIVIKTYPVPHNILVHDVPTPILVNSGDFYQYQFNFQYAPREDFLSECFGKYGEDWKWSTFTESDSALPCTWNSLRPDPGNNTRKYYPKKWHKEKFDNVDYVRTPLVHTLSTIQWYVNTDTWSAPFYPGSVDFNNPRTSADVFRSYVVPLSVFGNNVDKPYVVSSKVNTDIVVLMRAQFACKMQEFDGITYDWIPRLQTVWHGVSTYTYPVPNVLLYTPNKYVLKSQ